LCTYLENKRESVVLRNSFAILEIEAQPLDFANMLLNTLSLSFLVVAAVKAAVQSASPFGNERNGSHKKSCIVRAGGSESIDDAPAIIDAFNTCGHDGRVVFSNTTYHINSVMNTTGLNNCEIDLHGTLLVY
jgi:galacturan 1,4-alpha-galacturonidase